MTTSIVAGGRAVLNSPDPAEVHALAEEIHSEEGLSPMDALAAALRTVDDLEVYAIDWDAFAHAYGIEEVQL